MTVATRLPGPPQLLPQRPDAVVDLRTHEGAALVGATWRYADARLAPVAFARVGSDLGPSGPRTLAHVIRPRAEAADFDDAAWRVLEPPDLELRLGPGLVSAGWYRTAVTIPPRVGDLDPSGATVVFEVVVDDYAEVWVDGALPRALGDAGGAVVSGFNVPNRVVLTFDARPGDSFRIAVFGINGPVSAAPRNYIWLRSATLDFYAGGRARAGEPAPLDVLGVEGGLDAVVPSAARLERVATGFRSTAGAVWFEGALLFSDPEENTIYRWSPEGRVTVFRPKSGYAGLDIGSHPRPGAGGLAVDPEGRLSICQHGNRRIVRVNPRGDVHVVADAYEGKRLNSPSHAVFRSDGTLFFTDPPLGLPGGHDDPKRELPFAGVFRACDGRVDLLTDELACPEGIALSPDGRRLYVGNTHARGRVVMRYDVDEAGDLRGGAVLTDLTGGAGRGGGGGIAVDAAGNVLVCAAGEVCVVAPDGALLGVLRLPEAASALAWGGEDAPTLYVTATTSVYRLLLARA